MKKQSFYLAFMLTGTILTTYAQKKFDVPAEMLNSKEAYAAKKPISKSILTKFKEDHPNVTDDAWATTEKGFLVNFSSGEIRYTVFLDHRGIKTSQIRYGKERLLPDAARKRVKDNFPCFKLGWVKEISTMNGMAYQVRIENDWEWKVLKLNNEEMDIMEVYKKD